jgi:hypothetical protein
MCVCVLLKIMRGRERCCEYCYSKRADKIDIESTTPPSPILILLHSILFSSSSVYSFCNLPFQLIPPYSISFLPFLVFMISTSTSEIIHAFLPFFLLPSSFFPSYLTSSAAFDSYSFVLYVFDIQNLRYIHLKSIQCRRLFESIY